LFEFDTPSGEITLLPTDASGTVYREFDRAAPNGFRANTKQYVLVKPPEMLQKHLLNQAQGGPGQLERAPPAVAVLKA